MALGILAACRPEDQLRRDADLGAPANVFIQLFHYQPPFSSVVPFALHNLEE
jgi:hypothetical protein